VKIRGKLLFLAGLLAALGMGWVVFPYAIYERQPQPVDFSHKVHTGDKAGNMKCEDCHAFREDGTFAGLPNLEKCSVCHVAAMGTTAAEKKFIEQYVTANREPVWHVYAREPENVYFSHAVHIKLGKVACEKCHGGHGQTDSLRPYQQDRISGYSRDIWGRPVADASFRAEGGMKMDNCVDCHRKNNLTHACMDCHK